MKLPAFQFYPGDWRKDPGVQALNFHDRGVWLEMICLMHESEDRGRLTLNGQPMPEDALARLLGLDKQNLTTTLTTLLTYGVASRCEETGAIICRRMIRDENLRKIRTEAGKKGGNPVLVKQNPTTQVNQKSTPSSSSSISSSSSDNPPNPQGGSDEGEKIHVLPKGWQNMTATQRKQTRVATNSKSMNRIGRLMGRREGTLWTVAEAVALKSIDPQPDEIELMTGYYLADIDKDSDYRRRDMLTLLNNWTGELDRARLFNTSNH